LILPREKTLLGFAGAPWTVASYLIEGSSNKNFKTILSWMGRDPKDLSIALEYLARATTEYLLYQAKNGADIVQLFDTWACHMPKSFFEEHYAPILEKIFKKLEEENVRVIYFFKNAHHLIEPISKLSCKILSVDGLITLKEWDNKFQGKFSLQGNLDPTLLFTNEAIVRQKTRALVQEARTLAKPAIINLGHGILPKTPVQNVRAFVEEATTLWI
jgi:uroporphyrinogen decarboxylase